MRGETLTSFTDVYFNPYQTTMIELFHGNSQWPNPLTIFGKKPHNRCLSEF